MKFNSPILIIDTETGGLNPNYEIDWEVGGAVAGSKVMGTVIKTAPPILEIGAIVLDPRSLKEVDSFHRICGPEKYQSVSELLESCDTVALNVNGFRNKQKELASATPLTDCLKDLESWIKPLGQYIISGQNVRYDMLMINAACRRRKIPLVIKGSELELRTCSALYFAIKGNSPRGFKLTSVAAALGIPTDSAHSAMGDIRMCAECFRKIISALER